LSNWFQAACGLVGIATVLLINVLPVTHIINDNRPAFQFKKDAVISGAQPVFVFEPLELLDIRRQVILQPVNFPSNQTPNVLGQRPELDQGHRQEFNLIPHGCLLYDLGIVGGVGGVGGLPPCPPPESTMMRARFQASLNRQICFFAAPLHCTLGG
jgi:hypothetical protein